MISFTKTLSDSEATRQFLDLTDDKGNDYGHTFPRKGAELIIITEYRTYTVLMQKRGRIAGDLRDWYSAEVARAGDVIRIEYDEKAPQMFGATPIRISFLVRGVDRIDTASEGSKREKAETDVCAAKQRLRRLKKQGVDRFGDFLDALTGQSPPPCPVSLLTDPQFSEEVTPSVEIEHRTFGSRFDAAEYLFNLFKESGLTGIEQDQGLWAWLSLFYFDELCPQQGKGRRLREKARYFPELRNYQRYYRHSLAGSYLIYSAHHEEPSRTLAFLCAPLHIMNDIIEQLASRLELVTNPGLVSLATALYYDPQKSNLRRGAGGKSKGAPRRLADVMNQFDVTWDLYSMTKEDLLQLLPSEFDRFTGAEAAA